MKIRLLLVIFFFSTFCFAQEICDNGIDDDGDGLIDLNDSDCACNIAPVSSIIPNGSFEDYSECPDSFSQLDQSVGWVQATIATTDYHNTCGYVSPAITDLGLIPFPDGNGIVGTIFGAGWQEYVGSCLNTTMIAGTNYQFKFFIASYPSFGDEVGNDGTIYYSDVDVTLYGAQNCSSLPVSTLGSPNLADPDWVILGSARYMPQPEWGEITISFTPSTDINTIMFGSPPVLPPSYSYSDSDPYFIFDGLVLNEASLFGAQITQSGTYCGNNVVLTTTDNLSLSNNATYQWYNDGIAIAGATLNSYSVPPDNDVTKPFSVRIIDGTNCFVSQAYIIIETGPAPQFTFTRPDCVTHTGTITITTPAAFYSFDDGNTWSTSPTSGALTPGFYQLKIKSSTGCISLANRVRLTDPNPIYPIYYTSLPGCVNGTITISNTSPGWQYSFDGGATWSTSNTASLPPGTYNLQQKAANGCLIGQDTGVIPEYSDVQPEATVIQPSCTARGSITITTLAAEYSFDNGATWGTSPVLSNLSEGNYNIKIKGAEGCISPAYSITLLEEMLPFPQFVLTPITCGSPGSILITTVAPEYSFDYGVTWTTNPYITTTTERDFSIMVRNASGCSSPAQGNIINMVLLPVADVVVVQPNCVPGSITVTTPAAEYSFDYGLTWTTNPVLNNLPVGWYYVAIRTTEGCESTVLNIELFNSAPNAPNVTFIQPSCQPGSITVTTIAAEYSFDGGTTWTTNPVKTNLPEGSYNVMTRNGPGCQSLVTLINLIEAVPTAPLVTITNLTCLPGSITVTTVAAEYSFDGGTTWTTDPVKNNLAAGPYTILTRDAAGCESPVTNVNLNQLPPATAPLANIVQPSCQPGSITITTAAAQYSFDGGITWTTNPVLANLTTTQDYDIRIKNAQGCESDTRQIAIIAGSNIPPAPATVVNHPVLCTQQTGTITITDIADSYSFDNGTTWTSNNTSGPLAPGPHLVKVKNNLGCESLANTAIINVPPNTPLAPTATVTDPTCTVDTGSIEVTDTAPFYSYDNGTTWVTNNTAALAPGTYLVKVKNAAGCESAATTVVISADSGTPPAPATNVTPPTCYIATGTITVLTPAAAYSFDNGLTWVTSNTSLSLPVGTYFIKIKSTGGCESSAVSVAINPPQIVDPPQVSDIFYCIDATATALTATGSNLLWYNDAVTGTGITTAPVPLTSIAGEVIYFVSQNINGCESDRAPLHVVTNILLPPAVPNDFEYCQDEQTTALYATGQNLLWYTNEIGGTGSSVAPVPASNVPGIFNFYVSQSSNGCESDRATITVIITPRSPGPIATTHYSFSHRLPTHQLQAQGNNLTWYNESMDILASAPTPSSANIGQFIYYVSQTVNGCPSPLVKIIVDIVPYFITIKYPKYFTPNSDGTHETWNVYKPEFDIRVTVYIFDRYGKLITQLFAPGPGWDGTLNGHNLPSTDYWFRAVWTQYGQESEIRSHFSLVR